MQLFKRKTREEKFWNWFADNQDEIMHFERDQDRIFNKLIGKLREVDPDLVFEFGPKGDTREFVIGAAGLKRAFPAVTALVSAAPKLPGWKFTAFRPRRTELSSLVVGGKRVAPEEVQFVLLEDPHGAAIHLFLPGYREGDEALATIGFLFLDQSLGEYDVETYVGLIQIFPSEPRGSELRYPLAELAARFDAYLAAHRKQPLN
jgi:hypothetical protein